jgi:hypothetical protein
MGKIDEDYGAETARVIATRLPYAALGFIATMACAWIFEHHAHPERFCSPDRLRSRSAAASTHWWRQW